MEAADKIELVIQLTKESMVSVDQEIGHVGRDDFTEISAITCAHAYPSFGAKSGMAYRNWHCRTMDRIMVGRTIIFYQSGAQSVKKLMNHHYSSSLCYSLIL